MSDNESLHAFWLSEIKRYESDSEKWVERGKKVVKRFKDERGRTDKTVRFNILWANVQTLKPALYGRDPVPRVKRRFKDRDQLKRISAEVLERCLTTEMECTEFGAAMRQAVSDRLLPGRGTVWIRYVPHLRDQETSVTDDQPDEDAPQELYYEEAVPDYVHWQDFGHTYARTWEELRAVWRIAYMTRDEGIERFGDVFKSVELDYSPFADDKRYSGEKTTDSMKRACVYEIWDKDTRKAIWLTKGYDEVLDVKDDPLELEGFFPCPKPMFANLANDTLIPVPDYTQYQDQADEIDELTNRIGHIARAIKVAGAYDGKVEALGRLLTEGLENQLVAVTQWSTFAERGGLEGAISFLPIKEMAETLIACVEAREKAKQDLYEVTGISDIVRGFSSGGDKTATEQQIKSQYANLRLSDLQRDVQAFCRDALRIMGQIVAYRFSQESIAKISGYQLMTDAEKEQAQMMVSQYQQMQAQHQQLAQQAQQMGQPPPPAPQPPDPKLMEGLKKPSWEQVMGLLRNHQDFGFSIEIETDSTVMLDEQADKESDALMVQALGQFAQAMGPAVQLGIIPAQVARTVANSMVRKYRFGRDVEEAIEDTENQPMPQQQVDPKQVEAQQKQLQQAQAKVDQDAKRNQDEALKTKAERMDVEHSKAMQAVENDRHMVEVKSAVDQIKLLIEGFKTHAAGIAKDQEARAVVSEKNEERASAQQSIAQFGQMVKTLEGLGQQVIQAVSRPKQIIRGPDGRANGIAPVEMQ